MRKSVLCLLLVSGCSSSSNQPPPKTAAAPPSVAVTKAEPSGPPKSLYERLGGRPAISAVVDEFYSRVGADKRINQRFFNVDVNRLRGLLVAFVCSATGGPEKYEGRDMHTTHAGMDLVDDEFTALVEDLKGALDKFKVPDKEQGELLGALAQLKPQVVVAPGKLKPIDAAKLEPAKKLAEKLPPEARDLLELAVVAGGRGQRNYAEQLFSRAEMIAGADAVAPVASVFREGAPPRITTALKKLPESTPAQPVAVGNSDEEDGPPKKPARGSLRGSVTLGGQALTGMAVVMLEPASGKFARRTPKQRVIEQRGRQFAPRIMAVPVGSTVSFPNFDAVFHNVFSLSETKPFDLGLYKNGEAREVKFDKEGIIQLGCNLHPNMSAYLLVVAAPHYAIVDSSGGFNFRSLAPGKYNMKTWSDRSAVPHVQKVVIKPGENKVVIDLKADAPPSTNSDKFGAPRAAM